MMMDSIDTDFYLFIYWINSVFKTMIMFFSNELSHWTVLLVPYFVLETMVTVCWGYLCFF